jgi:protein-arginine kinase activator protein McsA
MTCSYCSKKHSFVLSKIRNGNFIQVAVCDDHAVDFESQFVLKMGEIHFKTNNLVSKGHNYDEIIKYSRENSNKKCVKCGIPVETFLATGIPSCNSCYDSFFSMVISILDNYGELFGHYNGDSSALKKEDISEIIEGYKKRLEKSIKREDFVKAAEIRDALNNIMGKIDHGSEISGDISPKNESSSPQNPSQREDFEE